MTQQWPQKPQGVTRKKVRPDPGEGPTMHQRALASVQEPPPSATPASGQGLACGQRVGPLLVSRQPWELRRPAGVSGFLRTLLSQSDVPILRFEHNLQPPGVGNPPAAQTSAPLLASCSRASSRSEAKVRRARRLPATCAEGHQLLMCQTASSSLTWPGDRMAANLAKRH
ncbi:unnamed protein product, partial [Rangifer tarandus platyrhynchus]